MTDNELRGAVLEHLRVNRTTGADGRPLAITDANLAPMFGVDIEQVTRVLHSLMKEGLVHGRPTSKVTTTDVPAGWAYLRLAGDPLPQ